MSDKIDFTTLKYLSGMPVAKHTQAMGYGSSIPIYRIGNLVIINSFLVQTINPGEIDWTSLSETVKSGYRPIAEIYILANGYDNYNFNSRCWRIGTNGSMSFLSMRDGANKRFYLSSCWITRDAFPEDDII